MLTAALILLALLLAVALGVVVLFWRSASTHVTELQRIVRHQLGRIDGYRAELDALSFAPPAAVAALQPDAPSLLPDEVERWLRARTPTIRPAAPDTEDPR